MGQLLSNLATTEMRVAAFEFDDGFDYVWCGAFRTGFVKSARREEPLEFELCKCSMTAQ
jgi:hypothetical protein